MGYGIRVLATGDRACFTRPELKVERVSYDVITPSAARGMIEAVYWKPAIAWKIDRIIVLNEIRFDSFRRNEVASKLDGGKARTASRAKPGNEKLEPLIASEQRQQRLTIMLRDVAYLIDAHFEMTARAGAGDTPEKHYNMAVRRLRKGQHFQQPCFGCREFPAHLMLYEDEATPPSFYADVPERDLGYMLYDLDYKDPKRPTPSFFRAVMRHGVIDVAEARSGVVS